MDRDLLSPLDIINRRCPATIWQIQRVHGSIVDIDCGERLLSEGDKYHHGSLYFSIYMADWTLKKDYRTILTSDEMNYPRYDEIFATMVGLPVIRLEEVIPREKLRLRIGDNMFFTLREYAAYYGADAELLWGFVDGIGWWEYSPEKGFGWEKKEPKPE